MWMYISVSLREANLLGVLPLIPLGGVACLRERRLRRIATSPFGALNSKHHEQTVRSFLRIFSYGT